MKNEVKKGLLTIFEKTVRLEVQKNEKAAPSICPFILHQPKRPKKKNN